MRIVFAAGAALVLLASPAFADGGARLASHRAGYEISLGGVDSGRPGEADATIAATGLIA